jgi:RNA polymerase-binding transcription factor DksA
MGMENPENIISDEEVLTILAERLKKVRTDLGKSDANEDPGLIADDEDQEEAGEHKDTQQAIGNELQKEMQEIEGAIKWIKEHGNACAYPGCSNKVENRRREADPASITCTKHMEDEDQIFHDLAMTS